MRLRRMCVNKISSPVQTGPSVMRSPSGFISSSNFQDMWSPWTGSRSTPGPRPRYFSGSCRRTSASRSPALYLPALHELDHLAVRPSDEGNPDLDQWIGTELPGHGLDARVCAASYRPGVGSIGIGDAQAEVQQCSLGAILVRTASATFGLNCRGMTKNLDETPVASVQEGGAIDAAGT